MPIVKCSQCGKEIKKNISILKRNKHNFCSRTCYNRFMKTQTGEKNSNWRGGRSIKKECVMCGKIFFVYPYEEKRRQFCSRKCLWEWRRKNIKGRKHPQFKERIEKVCEWCNKKFYVYPFLADKQRFCSHACYMEWWRKNLKEESISNLLKFVGRGEKSPSWRGGKIEKICQQCGKKYFVYPYRADLSKYCSHRCANTANSRKNWQNKDFIAKVIASRNAKPNKFEKRIDDILNKFFPNEFKYNGDFSQGVALNRQIPDFVNVNGKKCVIECFGEPFHDGVFSSDWKDTEFGKKAIYSQLGYKCLVLWYDECKMLNDEDIAEKVRQFLIEK